MLGCIFLGAPGSGKGTQAKRLQARFQIPHISTGDMLRKEIDKNSALGQRVKAVMDSGKLVSDELMLEVIQNRFSDVDVQNGFVLDGYPRTSAQAVSLEKILEAKKISLPKTIYLNLSGAELMKRLLGRLSCVKCGHSFHRELNPPKRDMICDACGSQLVQRKDDSPEAVSKRLEVYEQETSVLLKFYQARGCLVEVNGLQDMDKITQDIEKALGVHKK